MKQKLLIIFALVFLVTLLIGLNAATFVQKDREPDKEITPNRSTYNTGATGTRAFFDLLSETGHKVTRWQESISTLSNDSNNPNVFVIIGQTRLEIDETESRQLLEWVSKGGKLVLIDREIPNELLTTTSNWEISLTHSEAGLFGIDPSEQIQMTASTPAIKPSQASIFNRNVNAVQPSRFASSINLKFGKKTVNPQLGKAPPVVVKDDEDDPPPKPKSTPEPKVSVTPIYEFPTPKPKTNEIGNSPQIVETSEYTAPFVHLSDNEKTILVDFKYGAGQIVVLSDSYIVSNSGISLVDNAQLAINVVGTNNGVIAFDEYHQGYGANGNRLLSYFAGTPVLPILGQILLIVGLILFSQSRRFARALPAGEPDRLSKLEYVTAMAELQQRTKAYDLALENIFSEFRRSVSRLFGVDNAGTSRKDLAKMIAERMNGNELEIYNLMKKCEEIIQGEPTNKREVLNLTARLREIEDKLNIKRSRVQKFGKR